MVLALKMGEINLSSPTFSHSILPRLRNCDGPLPGEGHPPEPGHRALLWAQRSAARPGQPWGNLKISWKIGGISWKISHSHSLTTPCTCVRVRGARGRIHEPPFQLAPRCWWHTLTAVTGHCPCTRRREAPMFVKIKSIKPKPPQGPLLPAREPAQVLPHHRTQLLNKLL